MTFILLLAAAALANGVIGEEFRIRSVDEFIEFKDNVNNGTNYYGTTIFLNSDLSLAGKSFEPIGNSSNYFRGVFDGQGHVISNLTTTSSSLQYVGLFGFSRELTIKNVILDSSCSITSSFIGSSTANIGGIIGYCYASGGPCIIENSVNMGSVSFSGNISSYLYLGGITGYLSSSDNYDFTVKNCANYGDVTHSGESGSTSYIGGIAGWSSSGSSTKRVNIYNCLNHGTITHNGTTTSSLYLGGIAGYTSYTIIENCVSGGKISMSTTASSYNYIGSIVGYVVSDISINYTYFTSELSGYKKYGSGTTPSEFVVLSYDSTSFELKGTVSIGDYTGNSLIGAINAAADYNITRDYSHWLLNKGKNAVGFNTNGNSTFTLNSQVILLPSLVGDGNKSFKWFTCDGLETSFKVYEVTNDTIFYRRTCGPNFTVTLDANGGEPAVEEITIGCDRVYGDLSNAEKAGYTFLGWFTERTGGDKVESGNNVTTLGDHTLYAQWTNVYTVTFDPTEGSVSQSTKVVTFGSAYGELPTPTRDNHTFLGWFTEKNEAITERSIVNISENHTLFVYWLEFRESQVEIVFYAKDMPNEDVEKIIKEYTKDDFVITIIEFSRGDEDGMRVIAEFVDVESARNFVEIVEASSEAKDIIKDIKKISDSIKSFSPAHHPMSLFYLI